MQGHAPQDGRTPLFFAAFHDHVKVVQMLLKARANKEAKDKVRTKRVGEGARKNRGCVSCGENRGCVSCFPGVLCTRNFLCFATGTFRGQASKKTACSQRETATVDPRGRGKLGA